MLKKHHVPTTLLNGSIRNRLILSFSAVAALAVLSMIMALVLLQVGERQTRQMVTSTLPIVANAQSLGRDIALFAAVSRDLPQVRDEQRYNQLLAAMQQGITEIERRLGELSQGDAIAVSVLEMAKLVAALRVNMQQQQEQAQVYLDAAKRLTDISEYLHEQQQAVALLLESPLLVGYQEVDDQRRQVTEDSIGTPGVSITDNKRPSPPHQNHTGSAFLVGATLGEAGGMHELTAATSQAFIVLREVRLAETRVQVAELERSFIHLSQLFARYQLDQDHVTPEHTQLMQAVLELVSLGRGEESVFQLRSREVSARTEAVRLSAVATEVARNFSAQSEQLTDRLRAAAADDSAKLQRMLTMAMLIQVVLIAVVLLVSGVIGWYYVGRHLVARIIMLKTAMNQHAMGMEAAIPLHGRDEISDMAQALQCFVRQRSTVETALRQSIDSLNEAQLIAKFGSCTRDVDRQHWQWSDGFCRMLGYEPGALPATEQQFLMLVDDVDRPKVERFFQRLKPSTRVFEMEFTLRRSDGSPCVVATRWKFSTVRGKITGALHGTLLDITERRQFEEELLKVKKLESIGVLAGGIAHDFNNLLTVIMGNTALARRFLPDDHEAQNCLRLSENAANRARDLTKRLLTFAKGGEPIRTVTDVRAILAEVAEFVLHGSNVTYESAFPEMLWAADVDAGQISQVFQNLVVNADQAMPDGGNLRISCANVTVMPTDSGKLVPGDYVRVDISDEGHGIAEEDLKRVFDPYFTTRDMDSAKGSGLGLAIVHSIVRKHGGGIDVTSAIGIGTTFTVYLPARRGGVDTVPALPTEVAHHSGLALVMDDEDMVREVAATMLQHLGYEALLAADGDQAVEMYRHGLKNNRRPDLVILDLTVPGGCGGEKAARELLQLDPTARLIVSSGYATDHVVERYRDYGFCAIANKPYRLTELSAAIEAALAAEVGQTRN